jgi:hypothetical protein
MAESTEEKLLAEEKYAVWWLAADNGTIIYLVDNDTMKKESAHVKKESADNYLNDWTGVGGVERLEWSYFNRPIDMV